MSAQARGLLVSGANTTAGTPSLARKLFGGVSALMVSASLERGLTFLAHLTAARMGGAATFGGYSLALTTANNIASYAGAGIGSTATRFAGAYGQDSPSRRTLGRALVLVGLTSAALAAFLLIAGAGPIATLLLRKPDLASLLRWAALPAAAAILLECYRGYLVGQRNFAAQIRLAALVGAGLLVVLPLAARWGAMPMVCGFAFVSTAALASVLFTAQVPRGGPVAVLPAEAAPTVGKLAREVWHFGAIQLLGVIGLNAAGLWMASLLVRFDSTMVQMGLFAAANQIRNIAGLAPGLFTQSSFGLLADRRHDPGEVLGFSTVSAAITVVILAGLGIALLPWVLPLLYGRSFTEAVLPASVALATAIVHLSNGPAAARLNIVALKVTGAVNAVWSATVFGFGALLLSHRALTAKPAMAAMLIYLAAHIISAVLVFALLRRRGDLPKGFATLLGLPTVGAVLLALLAFARSGAAEESGQAGWTAAIVFFTLLAAVLIFEAGRRKGWAPRLPSRMSGAFGQRWSQ